MFAPLRTCRYLMGVSPGYSCAHVQIERTWTRLLCWLSKLVSSNYTLTDPQCLFHRFGLASCVKLEESAEDCWMRRDGSLKICDSCRSELPAACCKPNIGHNDFALQARLSNREGYADSQGDDRGWVPAAIDTTG